MYAAAIAAGIALLEQLMENIPKWIAAARQNKELTDDQDAAFEARFKAAKSSPAWAVRPNPPN